MRFIFFLAHRRTTFPTFLFWWLKALLLEWENEKKPDYRDPHTDSLRGCARSSQVVVLSLHTPVFHHASPRESDHSCRQEATGDARPGGERERLVCQPLFFLARHIAYFPSPKHRICFIPKKEPFLRKRGREGGATPSVAARKRGGKRIHPKLTGGCV